MANRYVTEERKLQQFEYLENGKSFFDEMKIIFMIFEEIAFHKNKKSWARTNCK